MKFFTKRTDGGKDSTVVGYWLIEWKKHFSIALLKFNVGSRTNYHNHAFHAFSWILKGDITEHFLDGTTNNIKPSWVPFITSKETFHKVFAHKTTWALTFRGKWGSRWQEYNKESNTFTTLTEGRKIVYRDKNCCLAHHMLIKPYFIKET